MNSPYIPIDCGVHDRLLHLATLRQPCQLTFVEDDGIRRSLHDRIVDVYSRNGAEYLRLEGGTVIRLDRLRTVEQFEVHPAVPEPPTPERRDVPE